MVTGSCRPFSQCLARCGNEKPIHPTTTTAATQSNNTTSASTLQDDEEDIEQLDPKEYPELYSQEDEEDEVVDTEWFVDHSEEEFVPLWQQRAMGDHLRERQSLEHISKKLIETGDMSPDLLKQLLEENKMENVRVMDVRGRCDFTDYMIVAESSMGDRFLTNAAELLRTTVRRKESEWQGERERAYVSLELHASRSIKLFENTMIKAKRRIYPRFVLKDVMINLDGFWWIWVNASCIFLHLKYVSIMIWMDYGMKKQAAAAAIPNNNNRLL